jgi:hypothetical protein
MSMRFRIQFLNRIRSQGFDDQIVKFLQLKKNPIQNAVLFYPHTSMKDVQATKEARKREHPAFQNMIFLTF